MSTINQKLGLKAKTRKRAATHGAGIVSAATCPNCPHRYVREHVIHGKRERSCAYCGHRWPPPEAEA